MATVPLEANIKPESKLSDPKVAKDVPVPVPVDGVGCSVAGTTHARSKRDLKAARPYRVGTQSFYENAQVGSMTSSGWIWLVVT